MSHIIGSKDKFPIITTDVRYNVYSTYPTPETEEHVYKLNNVTMFTCTITYTDSTKEELVSVEWT